ncbi:MAG TPA: YbhB/YbcL family Raf kinase inhibitor-like protein [Povalibacter sp.]|nr:YbhB/YbcL family Raf kinase inhibitor-like protein [Povalibacter sp.]
MNKRMVIAAALMGACTVAGAADFTAASNDVAPGKTTAPDFIFSGFGCTGRNVSPELHWSGAPAGTQSFALTVYDPDAPTGSGWWHWFVVNLPASTTSLAQGVGTADGAKLPSGAQQIRTDFGATGYGGPCPPQGDKPHRYIVKVHALKVPKLDIPADATAALAGFMVNANTIGTAGFTFAYGR